MMVLVVHVVGSQRLLTIPKGPVGTGLTVEDTSVARSF